MTLQIAGHQAHSYQVTTPIYEGPLDLLLDLIERAELDITRLALAQVTDQYLTALRAMENRDAAEVSAFLVIAAKLIQIKSESLLPRPPIREVGEQDPGEALAQQLILYKRFKRLSAWLLNRDEQDLRTYLRLATPPHHEGRLDMTGISLSDLVFAAQSIFHRGHDLVMLNEVVSIPLLTIRDKIRHIISGLKEIRTIRFSDMVGQNRTRMEVVVTFLAVLELMKQQVIEAHQNGLFQDIEFEAVGELDESADFDLEMGVE